MCKRRFVTFDFRQVKFYFLPVKLLLMRLNLTEFFYDCITNTKTTKNTIYVVTSCDCDINDLESFSDQTDTKFWPIISFKLAKNSHKFFYQLRIWFLKEEIHYVGNNLCFQWLTSLVIYISFFLVNSILWSHILYVAHRATFVINNDTS